MIAPETQVAISREATVPEELIADFEETLKALSIPHEAREQEPRLYNALEHYIPTIVVIFLAKPFFESFLKEAGKDTYTLFKQSLACLIQRASLIKVTIIASGRDKIKAESPYSRVISVYTRSHSDIPIKFLIPSTATKDDYLAAVDAMLELLRENHSKNGDDRLSRMLSEVGMKSLQVFRYSNESRSWLLLPKHVDKSA